MNKGDEENSFIKNIITTVASGVIVAVATNLINDGIKLYKGLKSSIIDIGMWDSAFDNVNKLIYLLDKDTYTKYRTPTTNKEYYELTDNISYFIKKDKDTLIKVESYKKETKSSYQEPRLTITFYGKKKYKERANFLNQALNMIDKTTIKVNTLTDTNITCQVIPHSFDNLILDEDVKNRMISGLNNWNKNKKWYTDHQLVHKIGVLLYGDAGTGKSSVAKAISNMFDNAPIYILDYKNICESVHKIVKIRHRRDGIIIVLIEDFDMFVKDREKLDESKNADLTEQLNNQNAMFQLLDGIYSTEDTIYVATTNYKGNIDSALIRHGRFDIQEELKYFNKDKAIEFVKMMGYNQEILEGFNLDYPVQPALLQSKVMEYRSNSYGKGEVLV